MHKELIAGCLANRTQLSPVTDYMSRENGSEAGN